ncbi:MAG: deoxyribodipyrimidine photolyase [Candidatus Muproteobacteria bacterium RBG_16_62_13]|uniref:Deoxyribodipyrimidine photolyase n=1 Tax=Candidatus Muproteobacteria bacterium RBG_16_62_13 TaxID=1817756 RepID=A0A1F6T748_9PROT|nr:MAG: deoxyribodipyrimidine photolyase [Candidatus Muproteobacteria bacterium RBG_16_62_13]
MTVSIVWFRRDLRLEDNDVLAHALIMTRTVIPVYIHAPGEDGPWAMGAAQRWWLHHSLAALDAALRKHRSRLVIRRARSSLAGLRALVKETGAELVCWHRLYEPAEVAREDVIEAAMVRAGVTVQTFPGHLLLEPDAIETGSGGPYKVFTPYARAAQAKLVLPNLRAEPHHMRTVPRSIASLPLASLNLLPTRDWASQLAKRWQPGEAGAHRQLRALRKKLTRYATDRDRPAVDGTSHLSAHLHFGEITPARVWRETMMLTASYNKAGLVRGAETFQRELLWREFAHHVLHHFPKTPERPLDARFAKFPWRRSASLLHAWQRGETGIPVVDAGMRELMTTGAMHNRARLIVASFLTRHLRFHWREGARWFRESLVDADLANNTLNWQWVAGCGADAAPYFRIFNPVLQSRKFDPGGEYLARWLPALKKLPARYRHAPWLAPARVLAVSGLRLGKDYPYPVIDLDLGRAGALDAFRRWRRHAP